MPKRALLVDPSSGDLDPSLGSMASQHSDNVSISGGSIDGVSIDAEDLSGVVAEANGGAGEVTGILKANGSGTVSAAVAGTDYEAAQTAASQAEAEAGSSTSKRSFTPQRIGQAIAALAEAPQTAMTQAEAEAGTSTSKRSVTPSRLWQAVAAKMWSSQWCLLREDFLGGGNTDQQIGENGWRISVVGGSSIYATGEQGRPGVFTVTSAATTGAIAALYLAGSGRFQMGATDLNVAGTYAEFIFKVSAITNVRLFVGLANDATVYPTRGVYLELDTDSSDTNWMCVCRNSSVSTRTSSGVAAGTDWVRVRLSVTTNNQWSFSVNGGSATTITTNVPTSTFLMPVFHCEPRSNSARTLSADFCSVTYPVTR
jgi:hypothetical protein